MKKKKRKKETTDASQLQSSMRNEYFWKKTQIGYDPTSPNKPVQH